MDFLSGNTAIRTKNWRYIRYAKGGEELYDHRSDPNEWNNLILSQRELANTLTPWLPENYEEAVPTKGAYHFDLENYSWTRK